MLSRDSIAFYQERLEREIAELTVWLKKHSCLPPNEEFEEGQRFVVQAMNSHNCRSALERIADIKVALLRIQQGTFGICIDCGQEIREERLVIIPCASRCTSCQEKKGVRIH